MATTILQRYDFFSGLAKHEKEYYKNHSDFYRTTTKKKKLVSGK